MLSVGNMTLILDKFFFPRWLQTLALWLNHNPDYAQVTEWYSGWKRMISEELLNQPSIKGIGIGVLFDLQGVSVSMLVMGFL